MSPKIFIQICPKLWTEKWIVNSIPFGNGVRALKYLAQYVFRVAISNNRIIKYEDEYVTLKYKDSKTKLWEVMKLTNEEFMRRFLKHVLLIGFVKVRYLSLFATKNRNVLNNVKELLGEPMTKKRPLKNKSRIICCPKCGKEMKLITAAPRGWKYLRPPPDYFLQIIKETEQLS